MPGAPPETALPEQAASASSPERFPSPAELSLDSRFSHLRGLRWRIDLGVLPSGSPHPVDHFRRVAADSRRRYAVLRRRLLIDPRFSKEVNKASDLVMENPLSQNPDSTWGRFFRNAELEKLVDQDLSRLYPEHGSYFQTRECQSMLRRILLLWSLVHPEYGYKQGMHELLACLLYVLQADVQHFSQVRKLCGNHFIDKLDGMPFQDSNFVRNYDFTRSPISIKGCIKRGASNGFQGASDTYDLDPYILTIIWLTDSYGAEGELGILLSERFLEHDAYCMFDALMSGSGGVVAMADFFFPVPAIGSPTGLPPVIEASSAVYSLLSMVDSSLHRHLVELGVEPQYFALRWLRVLFGREFLMEGLLIIWDAIFSSCNEKSPAVVEDDMQPRLKILTSHRGALIVAIAVSMLLNVRSCLLASENATSCLQRLLNFPKSVNVKNLIEVARSCQVLALETAISPTPSTGVSERSKSASIKGHTLTSRNSFSPGTKQKMMQNSYWEEKWRVLHEAEEYEGKLRDQISSLDDTKKSGVARMESESHSIESAETERDNEFSVRRKLLKKLEKLSSKEVSKHEDPILAKSSTQSMEGMCLGESFAGEEFSSIFSTSTSAHSRTKDTENDTEKSSVSSCASMNENDDANNREDSFCSVSNVCRSSVSESTGINGDITRKLTWFSKERKLLSEKFHWLWRAGKSTAEQTSEKIGRGASLSSKSVDVGNDHESISCLSDIADENVVVTLRNLGQSMMENIQVIESAFQQDGTRGDSSEDFSSNSSGSKSQLAAVAALKELRKISEHLSEGK